ncbi:MAG: hypothetical protein JWS10_3319 [Cypionkella sp.]|nr:hypothetical protein [Cypionkella sp.]
MDPEALAIIRAEIPSTDMSEELIIKLLYTTPGMLSVEDQRSRARIVSALKYDPEAKWK